MNHNPDTTPATQVADSISDGSAHPAQVEWTARWAWARHLALFFSVVGIASGVFLAIAPFYFGTPTGSLASFIMPGVLGCLVVATHRLNFRRLRDPHASYSRGKLITFNLLLLAFFALGFVEEYQFGERFRHSPVVMVMFLLLGPLPFAVNALYLSLPCARSSATEPNDQTSRSDASEL
jgi:hypothetical protein